MSLKVVKRDKREVDFDEGRIRSAIEKAFMDVDGIIGEKSVEIINKISEHIKGINKILNVEDIQDIIENKLMTSCRKDVAKAYMIYREKRALIRDSLKRDEGILSLIKGANEELNVENSNKNATLVTTQRDYIAGEVSKDLVRRYGYFPRDVIEAHDEGLIHLSDLDYQLQPLHNCEIINLEDMLQNGTVINGVKIDKPNSFSTACTIATQIVVQVTSNSYGGATISLSHLSPFIQITRDKLKEEWKDKLSDEDIEKLVLKDIKKGIQTIQYQLITISGTNGQSSFLSLFMYINEIEDENGREDLALAIEEVLKQRILGVKNEKGVYITTAFPKLLYVLDENNITEDSKYWHLTKLSAECTSKRLVPDYISAKKMKELKEGNVFPCMGCRSFLQPYYKDGKVKFYGRFNQGVCSLNLVDVALSSKKNIESFWEIMDERLDLVFKGLMSKHNNLKGTKAKVAPILWQYGALARLNPEDTIDDLLYDDYSSISVGFSGLHETVLYMTGLNHTSGLGMDFGKKVMNYMNDKCKEWKSKTKIGFSLYSVPQESLTLKFAKAIQRRHGVIEGISDKNYIINSYHVNIKEKMDAFTKLRIESEYQPLSLGGAISYVETPNMTHNIQAILEVMQYIYNTIMYAEINTQTSYCHVCGGTDIKMKEDLKFHCPNCGNNDFEKMNIAVRVCGYLSTNPFNEGRAEDIFNRVYHLGCD